jgi:lantibiotic leader peptide-processing serine protease
MKRFAPLALAAAVTFSACADDSAAPLAPSSMKDLASPTFSLAGDVTPTDQHLVVFSSNNRVPRDLAARVAALGGTVVASYDRIGVAVVSGLSDEAAATFQSADDVQIVQRDAEMQMIDPITESSLQVMAADETAAVTQNPAGAFFYPRQWHLRAIGAEKAWAAGRVGSPNVTVAILDTGVSPTHPDLVGRIDFARSASFVPSDAPFVQANFPGMPDWVDLHYHGTHVAATVSSNAAAAAGVTSGVTLTAVKVLSRTGSGTTAGVLAGMMHAADTGADVINMSLGGGFSKAANPGFVSVINRATNHANRLGSLIVVAAGNSNYNMDSDSDWYVTYCMATQVVCVSATGPTAAAGTNGPWTNIDAKATYSNFGSAITLAAPGGNSGGSVTAACSQQSLHPQLGVCRTGVYVVGLSGTSMAAPHVAGLAALVVEAIGKKQPSLVANRMAQRADDLGVEGRDVIYGRGRINVAKALGL